MKILFENKRGNPNTNYLEIQNQQF